MSRLGLSINHVNIQGNNRIDLITWSTVFSVSNKRQSNGSWGKKKQRNQQFTRVNPKSRLPTDPEELDDASWVATTLGGTGGLTAGTGTYCSGPPPRPLPVCAHAFPPRDPLDPCSCPPPPRQNPPRPRLPAPRQTPPPRGSW
jgi:hypothetical protein